MVDNISASNITWKTIEKRNSNNKRLGYKKNSKLVTDYAGYVKNLQVNNPDGYIKFLFLNEDACNRRMDRYRKWYQDKEELLVGIEYLHITFTMHYPKKSDL